eukprot:CAMPEP_0119417400 /NCGR_PEP_ID=MMETSP1335-20130426/15705_1 /TAXON_ID=259385 /ORGANISM="Chrysoculter rhomboideus, Strain RCC1486" /LENGTH=103 /DNA_ID=CAMNT_0007442575 /DNA_START=346 /DNA_END=653 /DNA_ORIENTATION=+
MYAVSSLVHTHQEGDIVALEQDAANVSSRLLLAVHLFSVIKHKVHKLVEADDAPFDAQIGLLVEPHLYPRLVLQVPEDQVNGLGHHFLNAPAHGCECGGCAGR